jgi:hypothetical protein
MIGVFALLAGAAASPAESATCQRLAADFDGNEYSMGFMHDFHVKLHQIDAQYVGAVGTAEARAEEEKSARKIKETDDEYLARGDRIVALKLANGCTPPDHVTDAFTYSERNPNRKTYTPPSKLD